MRMRTVDDLYRNANERNIPLLSDYNAQFWSEYKTNHARYDKLFRRLYLSYKYFLQTGKETINEVTDNFIDDCYNHLLANAKKYAELYRMYVITDEEYSITENYNMTEIMDRDTSSNTTNDYGERVDGTQSTHKVVPYNTVTEYEDTSVTDAVNKGAQTDTVGNTATEDYTFVRHGNIGVQTGMDLLEKHQNLWTPYEFYEFIFREICKDLLLV